MTTPILKQFPDAEAVSRAAAEELVKIAGQAIAARGKFTLVLSGGSTPKRLYQLLAEPPYRGQVNWSAVHFFWGDERSVPPDHADSNFGMALKALLEKLALPASQIHRMQAERADREIAARDYQAEIARVFGISPEGDPPVFDLVLLGMGSDGHTASLFPHTDALQETRRWVVPNYVPKFNTFRMTMTPVILNKAAQVMFLVAGVDKVQPLAEVIEGPPESQRLPSQLIQPSPGKLIWLLDQEASKGLKKSKIQN